MWPKATPTASWGLPCSLHPTRCLPHSTRSTCSTRSTGPSTRTATPCTSRPYTVGMSPLFCAVVHSVGMSPLFVVHSEPSVQSIKSAVDTLVELGALKEDIEVHLCLNHWHGWHGCCD